MMSGDLGDFAGYPIGTSSQHFMTTYAAGDPDAQARALAIGATCENDLATLSTWFNCDFDSSPHGIWVHVPTGQQGGGATNTGYNYRQSSQMIINGTFASSGAAPNPLLRDEYARMLFVAELAEILMDFSLSAWRRGDSMGEGLSLLAAQTLHPIGYYATGYGPRINTWLTGGRPDWISKSEPTDRDQISFGCAIVFLNYLRYQKNFSFSDIVEAAGGGLFTLLTRPISSVVLADVFAKLTGEPASTAYNELTVLLDKHLPSGSTPPMPRDNLFPLLEPWQRAVSFSFSTSSATPSVDPEPLFVERKPGPICPAALYTYHNLNVSTTMTFTAETSGFALPAFGWSINGIGLPAIFPLQPEIVPMTATDTTPGLGEAPVAVDLDILFTTSRSGTSGTLTVFNMNFPGNGDVQVTVSAVESLVPGDASTQFTDTVPVTTRGYQMLPPWDRDVKSCNPRGLDVVGSGVRSLVRQLVDDLNRPNPNPVLVRAMANASRQYVEALDGMTGGNRGLEAGMAGAATLSGSGQPDLGAMEFSDVNTGLRIRVELPQPMTAVAQNADDDRTPATPPVGVSSPPLPSVEAQQTDYDGAASVTPDG
jgi:hypothetical protein